MSASNPLSEKQDFFVDLIRPNSGCKLVEECGYAIFKGVFDHSGGDPCNGCAYEEGSRCQFLATIKLKASQSRRENFGKVSFKTNAEIAEEKGISKRQVAKMRKRGEL